MIPQADAETISAVLSRWWRRHLPQRDAWPAKRAVSNAGGVGSGVAALGSDGCAPPATRGGGLAETLGMLFASANRDRCPSMFMLRMERGLRRVRDH